MTPLNSVQDARLHSVQNATLHSVQNATLHSVQNATLHSVQNATLHSVHEDQSWVLKWKSWPIIGAWHFFTVTVYGFPVCVLSFRTLRFDSEESMRTRDSPEGFTFWWTFIWYKTAKTKRVDRIGKSTLQNQCFLFKFGITEDRCNFYFTKKPKKRNLRVSTCCSKVRDLSPHTSQQGNPGLIPIGEEKQN